MDEKTFISDRKTTLMHTGLLAAFATVFLTSACATASPQAAAQTSPPAKKVTASKSTSRKVAAAAKAKSAAPPAAPAPVAAKPSKASSKPAASDEPNLPTKFADQIFCPVPPEIVPDEDLTIRCALKAGLGARSVILRYRVSGKEEYSTRDAIRSPKGWYVATIKGNEIRGGSLQFYVEAYAPDNRVAGMSGNDVEPNVILITGEFSGPSLDEDPLARIQREKEAEQMEIVEGRHRPSPSLWFGVGMGSGIGWYPKRKLERRPDGEATGWATGGLFHLLPELGYNLTPNIAVSLQGRLQFVKTETQGGGNEAKPYSKAYAVLACIYFMTASHTSSWQLFGTAAVGGGTAFRLYAAPVRSRDPSNDFPNSDTVNGGPLVAGAGGGVNYHLTNYLALTAHVRSLAGFPKSAVVIEGGIGAQLALWPFSAYQSKKRSQIPEDLEPEPEYTPPEE